MVISCHRKWDNVETYVQFIEGARFRKNVDIEHRPLRLTAVLVCSQTKVNGNEMLPYLFNE